MKKNTYRGILLLVLAVVILATVLVQQFWGGGGTEDAKPLPEKEKQEEEELPGKTIEEPWMPKHEIQTYENRPEDNRELPPSDLEVTFTGYAEHPEAFEWMDPAAWEAFQESLKGYREKKGYRDVTEANLHPDSILEVNAYEHYVYLDVDHANAYTDRMVLKAICDTYQEQMRFAFEIQYGE